MKKINPQAKYFETNHWILKNDDGEYIFTIGITDFAQTVFGNAISINIKNVGVLVQKGAELAIIESDKVSTEVESPMSGKIIEINNLLKTHPNWINESPYNKGWLVKIEITNPSELKELMTADEYKNYMNVFYNKV